MKKINLELFVSYIMSQRDELEHQISVLRQNIKFRNPETYDCLELMFAMQRLENFNEFTSHATILLNIESKLSKKE